MSRSIERAKVDALTQKASFPTGEFSLIVGKDISLLKIENSPQIARKTGEDANYYIFSNDNLLRGYNATTHILYKFDFKSTSDITLDPKESVILKLSVDGKLSLTPELGEHIRSGFWNGTEATRNLFPYISQYGDDKNAVRLRGGYFRACCYVVEKGSRKDGARHMFIMPNLGGATLSASVPTLNTFENKIAQPPAGAVAAATPERPSSQGSGENGAVAAAEGTELVQEPRFDLERRLDLILQYLAGVHTIYNKLKKDNFSDKDVSADQVYLDASGKIRFIHPLNALLYKLRDSPSIPGVTTPKIGNAGVLAQVIAILLGNEHFSPAHRLRPKDFHINLMAFPKLEVVGQANFVELEILVQLFLKKMIVRLDAKKLPFVQIEYFFKELLAVVKLINKLNKSRQPSVDTVLEDRGSVDGTESTTSSISINETYLEIKQHILSLLTYLYGRSMKGEDMKFFLALTDLKLAREDQLDILNSMVDNPSQLRYLFCVHEHKVLEILVTLDHPEKLLRDLLDEAPLFGGLAPLAQRYIGLYMAGCLTNSAIGAIHHNEVLKHHVNVLCEALVHSELLSMHGYDLDWFTASYTDLAEQATLDFIKRLMKFLIKEPKAAYLLGEDPYLLELYLRFEIYQWLLQEKQKADKVRSEISSYKGSNGPYLQGYEQLQAAREYMEKFQTIGKSQLVDEKLQAITDREFESYNAAEEVQGRPKLENKKAYAEKLVDEEIKTARGLIATSQKPESKKKVTKFEKAKQFHGRLQKQEEQVQDDLLAHFNPVYIAHCLNILSESVMTVLRPGVWDAYSQLGFFSRKDPRDQEIAGGPGSKPEAAEMRVYSLDEAQKHAKVHGDKCLWTKALAPLLFSTSSYSAVSSNGGAAAAAAAIFKQ